MWTHLLKLTAVHSKNKGWYKKVAFDIKQFPRTIPHNDNIISIDNNNDKRVVIETHALFDSVVKVIRNADIKLEYKYRTKYINSMIRYILNIIKNDTHCVIVLYYDTDRIKLFIK